MKNEEEIILAAQQFIQQHGSQKHGKPIQDLMDLVSGVDSYNMNPSSNQGYIYRKVIYSKVGHNYIIDIDQLISRFWYGVFMAVPKATAIGTVVAANGGDRKTKLTPLQFIRKHGVSAAHGYIDRQCKLRLRQQCNECLSITQLGPQREYDDGCPKCKSRNSTKPPQFMHRRVRKCMECGTIRATRFERVCGKVKIDEHGDQIIEGGCGSENISLIQIEDFVEASDSDVWDWKFGEDYIDTYSIESKSDIDNFVQHCVSSLPHDRNEPYGDTATKRILRIMVDPVAGRGICAECKRCATTKLNNGTETINHNECCGATSFSLDSCVNYSKKLGWYFGYAPALANRRVSKIRDHAISFSKKYCNLYDVAKYIATHTK